MAAERHPFIFATVLLQPRGQSALLVTLLKLTEAQGAGQYPETAADVLQESV